MRRRLARGFGRGLVVASLLCAGSATREAQALVTTTGCSSASSCTLAELFAGGVIQVNATRFENWELEFIDPDGVQPNFALIVVEGKDDGGLVPGDGIRFSGNGELAVSGSDRLDLAFGFTATSIASNREIQGNSLTILSDSAVGSAFLDVGEFVADQSGVGLGQKKVGTDPAFGPPIASDAIEFPAQTALIIEKDILLQSGQAGDSAELDTFEQRYALPEPEGAASLAAGVLVLLALRQRRSPRSAKHRRHVSTRGGH
jgi:hypothetical protein